MRNNKTGNLDKKILGKLSLSNIKLNKLNYDSNKGKFKILNLPYIVKLSDVRNISKQENNDKENYLISEKSEKNLHDRPTPFLNKYSKDIFSLRADRIKEEPYNQIKKNRDVFIYSIII